MTQIDRQEDLKGLGNYDLSPVKAKFFSKNSLVYENVTAHNYCPAVILRDLD